MSTEYFYLDLTDAGGGLWLIKSDKGYREYIGSGEKSKELAERLIKKMNSFGKKSVNKHYHANKVFMCFNPVCSTKLGYNQIDSESVMCLNCGAEYTVSRHKLEMTKQGKPYEKEFSGLPSV